MNTGEIILDAQTERLEDAISFIRAELTAASCPDDIVMQIELAMEEIFMNVASYAYDDKDKKGKIKICVNMTEKGGQTTMMIAVCDTGKPFNLLEHKDPDTTIPLEEREIGGLGILLVKKVMNSVTYTYKDGYNHVMMSKTW
ncbi:MAG: ATP-binding protein [Spirochaetaceae bacterium]|jgi:anti-sigma regulatory factor (Ser/Thr protein kinase)|nr:ATP-binding protein [Spirochaetaceae bacterium]